uniref:Uncharacterized protein n=1 Tax=Grammatophora oceanica TaxID=210454 RepID=A0A7S1VE11_9STRA|mmetsp:Transcript_4238/g.5853  ORF Transcript_4238/g.5853 Transcript_4238/m.5853 type:complete len:102 (+) Transcript_4238:378-683(+)
MTDLGHSIKQPRPFYGASFRPTSKPMQSMIGPQWKQNPNFIASAFIDTIRWIWNMSITYPDVEIYPCDGDIGSAFRLMVHNPNLVSMHGFAAMEKVLSTPE